MIKDISLQFCFRIFSQESSIMFTVISLFAGYTFAYSLFVSRLGNEAAPSKLDR